jgi:monoamine oxidase
MLRNSPDVSPYSSSDEKEEVRSKMSHYPSSISNSNNNNNKRIVTVADQVDGGDDEDEDKKRRPSSPLSIRRFCYCRHRWKSYLLSRSTLLVLGLLVLMILYNLIDHVPSRTVNAKLRSSRDNSSTSSTTSSQKSIEMEEPEYDQEGNNIHSPYYTDLDEFHQRTDPGDDALLRYMNASMPVNVLSKNTRQALRQSYSPQVGPVQTLVTLVGAGTAGLAAARQLQEEYGIHNYIIVEATSQSGGRVRKDTTFLENGYPIDLGAAVVHRPDLVEDYATKRHHDTNTPKRDFEYILMPNGEVTFYNYSYFDFVLDYVAPQDHEQSTIRKCPVRSVTCFGNRVLTRCDDQTSKSPVYIESRYVIMTASLQVLRDNLIQFTPPLPEHLYQQQYYKAVMWKGGKLFVRFSQNFYSGAAFCLFHCPNNIYRAGELEDGESFYWDHGIPGYHVVTGFIMGEAYRTLEELEDDERRIRAILHKMDELFDGQASRYYVSHVFMDWTREKYQRGTYSSHGLEGPHTVHGGQIMLAGEAFSVTEDGQGWVHGALLSGETAADYVAAHWNHIVKDCGSYRGCRLTNAREEKKRLKRTKVAVEPTENGLVFYDTKNS